MGSSSGSSSKQEKRFAPYIENYHKVFLTIAASRAYSISNAVSPYDSYEEVDVDTGYIGTYTLASFPSLYDMFGKFMAGLDIEAIWDTILNNSISLETVANVAKNDKALTDDSAVKLCVSQNIKHRDINSVGSSTFVVGKAIVEDKRNKEFSTYISNIQCALVDISNLYNDYLNWKNRAVVKYTIVMKAYLTSAQSCNDIDYNMKVHDSLWRLYVLDYLREYLMAMSAPTRVKKQEKKRERSTVSKVLLVASYTATGASIGFSCGGPWGAVIGAVIGVIVGIAVMLLE